LIFGAMVSRGLPLPLWLSCVLLVCRWRPLRCAYYDINMGGGVFEISVFEEGYELANTDHAMPLVMHDKEGKSFQCYVPLAPTPASKDDASTTPDQTFLAKSKEKLEIFFGQMCFYVNEGWWTYLACPGGRAKQFHAADFPPGRPQVPPDPLAPMKDEFILGEYDPEGDSILPVKDLSFLPSDDPRFSFFQSQERVYTQSFVGGTEDRVAQIYYGCGRSRKMPGPFDLADIVSRGHGNHTHMLEKFSPDQLGKLSATFEDPTHHYHLIVETPLLCDRDALTKMVFETQLEVFRGSKNCVQQKNEGWFTYNVCPGQHVQQYHAIDKKKIDQLYTLGKYDSETNTLMAQNGSAFYAPVNSDEPRAYREWYSGGTACDMTGGQPRSAEVHYTCSAKHAQESNEVTLPGAMDMKPFITDIQEGLTCDYTVTVHVPAACIIEHTFAETEQKSQSIQCVKLPNHSRGIPIM